MAKISPFKAFRPVRDKVHLVAARSYVTYNQKSLTEKLNKNPFSFLHVLNPQFGDANPVSPITKEGLKAIKHKFDEFCDENIFVQEEQQSFYVYRQKNSVRSAVGIICCMSIDEYLDGKILKHEETLTLREEKMKNYLEIVDINAEPVCLSYPDQPEINRILEETMAERPEYDFSTVDGIQHSLWLISDQSVISNIKGQFEEVEYFYIADGHHRSASSALLGKEKRNTLTQVSGNEGFNYFMSILFAESQIVIHEFNRTISDLQDFNLDKFLMEIENSFEVHKSDSPVKPSQIHHIGMYCSEGWYELIPKTKPTVSTLETLDAEELNKKLLQPILGIQDLKTDDRISFLGGSDAVEEIESLVNENSANLGFTLYPVSIEQLKYIAHEGRVMPPKSTWIEPKLMTGLLIYCLEKSL